MCGIVGFNWNDKKLLKKMMDEISYRGPDDSGTYEDENITLGHNRLSIIDLSKAGKQPMCNEEGNIWITFNGEIYNFQDIKKSLEKNHEFKSKTDTEVIIHLYEEKGIDFVKYLKGDFALFIYDSKNKKGYLARDKAGVKHVYYYFDKTKFLFSSEIKSLLKYEGINKEIDKLGLQDYLLYGNVTGDKTIVNNIKRVRPSEIIEIDFNLHELKKSFYYEYNTTINRIPYKVALKKADKIIDSAVKSQMIADVPVGAYLSGGIDSTTVVAYMTRYNKNLHTFSIGFDSDDVINELDYAKLIAERYNTNHEEIRVSTESLKILPKVVYQVDEPLPNLATIPYYYLSKKANKKVKVVLSGNGGDEVFAGYREFRIANLAQRSMFMKYLPYNLIEKTVKGSYKRYIKYLKQIYNSKSNLDLFNEIKFKVNGIGPFDCLSDKNVKQNFLKDNVTDIEIKKIYNNRKSSLMQKNQLLLLNYFLASHLLIVDDRMTMANSIESRVPILDNSVVQYGLSLPDKYKLLISGKRVLRDLIKDKAPKKIFNRNKYGFTPPLKYWFKEYFKSDAHNRLIKSDLFDKKVIQNKFDTLTNQNINVLWSIYWLELWKDIFIENEKIHKI